MFKKQIDRTILMSDIAHEVFPNIFGDSWFGDVSFVTTLRALCADRVPQEDLLMFGTCNISRARSSYSHINGAVNMNERPETLYVANLTTSKNDEWFESLEKEYVRDNPGWHRIEKVTAFYVKAFRVLCFTNPDIRSTVLFTDNIDMRRYHYLQVGIPAYLPWYFGEGKGLKEEELALLNTLRQPTSEEYEQAIEKIAERYDFRAMRIRNGLSGFETQREKAERDRKLSDIQYYRDEINRLNNAISDYIRQIRDAENLVWGLSERIRRDDGDSQLMSYFLLNPRLIFENIRDNTLTFGVKDYLTFFDEDEAKAYIENEHSILYEPNERSCSNIIPVEDMQMLMREIFIEQNLRIRMCAVFMLTIGGGVDAISRWNYSADYNFYMPNPHIHFYSCIDQNKRFINDCLSVGNYVGAVEQCVAACRFLTVTDYSVMCEFARCLYGISSDSQMKNTCIELPDGRVVNPKNAIKFLKGEKVDG